MTIRDSAKIRVLAWKLLNYNGFVESVTIRDSVTVLILNILFKELKNESRFDYAI